MHTSNTHRQGATLVELVLFIGITAMMTGVILSFSMLSTQVGMRGEVLADIEQAGSFATDIISERVRAADSVDAMPNLLTLIINGKETKISLEDDKIRMDEDGNVSYITPGNLKVEDLNFVLLGQTQSNKRGVTISFDIANPDTGDARNLPAGELRFHMTVAGR